MILFLSPFRKIIHPLTGERLKGWEGYVSPERLLDDLVPVRRPMTRPTDSPNDSPNDSRSF